MPYKQKWVFPYLDEVDRWSSKDRLVTIIHRNGKLKGYNATYYFL